MFMWQLSNDMQGNSGMMVAILGKDRFRDMAKREVERCLQRAAEAERNHWTTQADVFLKRALAAEEELALFP